MNFNSQNLLIMRTTTNFNFYCRASKANKEGLAPIELSIIINGQRHFYNLALKCSPKAFNGRRMPKDVQEYLDITRANINQCIIELARQRVALTADNMHSIIKNGCVITYSIEQLFKDYDDVCLGADMETNHKRKYTLVRDLFFEVVDKNREADSITNADILAFKSVLYKRMKETTAAGYMSRLKGYMNFGMNNQKLHTDPFAGIRIKRVEKEVETITEEELNRILNKNITNERLCKVRDLFAFSCGTGLAFADVADLRPEDFSEQGGRTCIFKQRHKTGVNFYSVLLPFAKTIAEKYNYDFSDIMLSNQKMNSYLKEIQCICGVTSVESLHFHLARHYYATNAINAGVPLEVVQKLVGHKRIQQTIHYAKMMKKTVVKSVLEHIDIL